MFFHPHTPPKIRELITKFQEKSLHLVNAYFIN